MANHAKVLTVSPEDRAVLVGRARSKSLPAKEVERARIVLLAEEGLAAETIAERVGVSRPTVVSWRQRYESGGIQALSDAARSGAPRRVDQALRDEILVTTLTPPPPELGISHWSSRLLAKHVGGVSHMTVARLWRQWGVKPWRVETFKFSTDPELTAKVTDIVGLYLEPPENAVVVCVDEKTQIQALERTAPILPLRPGLAERQTHDYRRHGTTTLFAALEVATGRIIDDCYDRHRGEEFLKFLKKVAKAYPDVELHVICDNYSAHKHKDVKKWLAYPRNQRITLHFTPTYSSWMNLVEVFFGIITRQSIRRGSYSSVSDLTDTIRRFIDAWNQRCQPFVWTKTADQILAKANRQITPVTDH